jgi:LysM repeat protein
MLTVLVLIVLVAGTGITVRPAQAASCGYYHIVQRGESLYWIGRYYGVSWTYLAQINGLRNPRLIYAGQKICISLPGSSSSSGAVPASWSYSLTNVEKDVSVTIRTYNLPSNVPLDAHMGRKVRGAYEWVNVGQLDSDAGGTIYATFNIPPSFAGESRIIMRLIQAKRNGDVVVDHPFRNVTVVSGGTGGRSWYYGGIPTIWIVSVVRNSQVTIRTHNFPSGLNFEVRMGPMGTRGVGGYYAGSFNSGPGGVMERTFTIPSQLTNHYRIAIRTQNLGTGYYSYNWFYNNTTP